MHLQRLTRRESPRLGRPWPSHLVEESLAEVLHGPLELVPLGLPLLVVAHVLSGGTLPGGCPGVVIHIVKPASGVCAFFPPANKALMLRWVPHHLCCPTTLSHQILNIVIGGLIRN